MRCKINKTKDYPFYITISDNSPKDFNTNAIK